MIRNKAREGNLVRVRADFWAPAGYRGKATQYGGCQGKETRTLFEFDDNPQLNTHKEGSKYLRHS